MILVGQICKGQLHSNGLEDPIFTQLLHHFYEELTCCHVWGLP